MKHWCHNQRVIGLVRYYLARGGYELVRIRGFCPNSTLFFLISCFICSGVGWKGEYKWQQPSMGHVQWVFLLLFIHLNAHVCIKWGSNKGAYNKCPLKLLAETIDCNICAFHQQVSLKWHFTDHFNAIIKCLNARKCLLLSSNF